MAASSHTYADAELIGIAKRAERHVKYIVRGALIGYLTLAVGVGYAIHVSQSKSYDARGVVCQIIKSGDVSAYDFKKEGTINAAQLHRALEQSVTYRKLLSPAKNCDTSFTPPTADAASAVSTVPTLHYKPNG